MPKTWRRYNTKKAFILTLNPNPKQKAYSMWNEQIGLDQQITLWINGSDNLWLDGFALSITSTMTWIPAALVLLYVIIRHGEMREILLTILALGLCILIADQTASGLFKPLVARPRPTHDPVLMTMVDVVNDYRGGQYGFFSSHAANTMSVAVFAALLIRHRLLTWVMLSWSLLNGWSRIYLGVHYFGDVMVGFAYGVLVGFGVYWLFRRLVPVVLRNDPPGMRVRTLSGFLDGDARLLALTLALLYLWAAFRGVLFAM